MYCFLYIRLFFFVVVVAKYVICDTVCEPSHHTLVSTDPALVVWDESFAV